MAVVVSQLAATVTDAVAGLTLVSNSATPGANELNIIVVTARNQDAAADPGIPSISGRNLTWTQGPSVTFATSSRRRITLFYGIGASPSTGTVTCTYGVNVIGKIIDDLATGIDTADSVIDTNNDTAAGTSTSVAGLAFPNAFGAAGNAAYMAVHHIANEATTHDSGGGFTEIGDEFAAQGGFMSQYQVADVDAAASWATSADYGAVCIEIKAAAAGTTTRRYSLPTIGVG